MEKRNIIIDQILENLYIKFDPKTLSKLTIEQYKDLFFSIFEYINFYKDKCNLIEEDFVEFSKNIHNKYNYDEYEDNCWERVAFFMDELIFRFSTPPPYFFHSNFEDFKAKLEKDFTEGNGL